jgi:two-component system, response regulator PdtaR
VNVPAKPEEPEKALTVDASSLVAESAAQVLEKAGFNAVSATRYSEAETIVGDNPDLGVLVADIRPEKHDDSAERMTDIAADNPDIAVVVTSASFPEELPELPDDAVFLQKPFGKRELLDAVDQAKEQTDATPQPPTKTAD